MTANRISTLTGYCGAIGCRFHFSRVEEETGKGWESSMAELFVLIGTFNG
jgi:hypothetical protein